MKASERPRVVQDARDFGETLFFGEVGRHGENGHGCVFTLPYVHTPDDGDAQLVYRDGSVRTIRIRDRSAVGTYVYVRALF